MGRPLTLYLIRHGEAAYLPEDAAPFALRERRLTPRGVEQIRNTAEALVGMPITAVEASPRARTRQSADIIGNALGVRVHEDARLQIGNGQTELEAFLADLRATHAGEGVAVVAHLDTLSLLRSIVEGDKGWFPAEGECLRLTLE